MDLDAQLLDRYTRTRDADAFTQLVRRHAGMVFAVAHRVTRDHHDAQEIAQTCFLELARQADSIHGSLAGWLHAVAVNRAADCNRDAANRRRHERAAARPEAQRDEVWDEIAHLVDGALAELPEELRLPMVLYHLEGRGQAEVAAELGINQSTVSRRLEAGVAALREKFKAAGVMTPSVALPGLLARHAIEIVPKTLLAGLGKLALLGFVPGASGVAGASGGGTAASGVSSVAAKSSVPLAAKIAAGFAIVATASTTGYLVLHTPTQPIVAVSVAQTPYNIAGYQGWVHFNLHVTGDADPENDEVFVDTVNLKMGSIEGQDKNRSINWFDPAAMAADRYVSARKKLYLIDLTQDRANSRLQQMQQISNPALFWAKLDDLAAAGGGTTSQTRDGDQDRLEFTGSGDQAGQHVSIWVDPTTRLISKMEFRAENNIEISDFQYGDRQIKDIYDLGVPRKATTIDRRMSGELKDLITRLDAQWVQDMGDGVGIETETNVDIDNPQVSPVPEELDLIAHQGASWVVLEYDAGNKRDWGSPGNPKATLPGGWPTPDLDEALRFADQLRTPMIYGVTDGKLSWHSQWIDSSRWSLKAVRTDDGVRSVPIPISGGGAFSEYLPDPGLLAANDGRQHTNAIELIRRAESPSLVGLHITYGPDAVGKAAPRVNAEETWWLDPARNDVPVEHDFKRNQGDELSLKTQYLEYAQLPDGRWYPTYWRVINSQGAGTDRGRDRRLMLYPGKSIDAKWFGDPTARFVANQDAGPGPTSGSLPAVVAAAPHAVATAAVTAYKSIWSWLPWAVAVGVFSAAGVLLIRQRRGQSTAPALRGAYGPRRK